MLCKLVRFLSTPTLLQYPCSHVHQRAPVPGRPAPAAPLRWGRARATPAGGVRRVGAGAVLPGPVLYFVTTSTRGGPHHLP